MAKQKVIIVGGGVAGLMTALKVAERGLSVDLFSLVEIRRSASVCIQEGISAAKNTAGDGDHPDIHFEDTIRAGDFLADQPPVRDMCRAAPKILDLLDRMGVPFIRTAEGHLKFFRSEATTHRRTASAGTTTGQHVLYALAQQLSRYAGEEPVKIYESWEFLSLIKHEDGRTIGIAAIHIPDMSISSFRADAVVMATGDSSALLGGSTASELETGAAASRCYQQGALFANGEFIQFHPAALLGGDKRRIVPDMARAEGAYFWAEGGEGQVRFLEEKFPAYGNLVPRDIASREIVKICGNGESGGKGTRAVNLDLTSIPAATLSAEMGSFLRDQRNFQGDDPRSSPLKVFPAAHCSTGGLWVDAHHQTNMAGLFAVGDVACQYHGANLLGANRLLACLHGAMVCAARVIESVQGLNASAEDLDPSLYAAEQTRRGEALEKLYKLTGPENLDNLWDELGELMTENMGVVRTDEKLRQADGKLLELADRWKKIGLDDGGRIYNTRVLRAGRLRDMIELARVMTLGALRRGESRGTHFKPESPGRDDENWLKTTRASASAGGPVFDDQPVDVSILKPGPRDYALENRGKAHG